MASLSWLLLAFLLLSVRECMSERGQPLGGPRLGLGFPGRSRQLSMEDEDWVFYNYTQTIDHFNYRPESYATFQQNYAVNWKYWGGADTNSPIFVYAGDEAPITESLGTATGIITDFAYAYNALIVYIEHRYYGLSVPFGSRDAAFQNASTLGYLSSTQALADYAVVIRSLKTNLSAEYCPVIVIGRSYGGMLAAWFRLKYPHIAMGALASSAPILYFDDITPEGAYYDVVSKDYYETSESCYSTIKQSWSIIDSYSLTALKEKFQLCEDLTSTETLTSYLQSMFTNSAQYDNPPNYPVKTICDAIDGAPEEADILDRIFAAVVAINGTNPPPLCYDISSSSEIDGYTWQRCTEMVMPIGIGNDAIFPESPYNVTYNTQICQNEFGASVTPRPHWITTEFGGHDINFVLKNFASNIIFSNGLRDPFSAGGVLSNISETVVAIYTAEGAHCADLHPINISEPAPEWLKSQWFAEMTIIQGWLADYNATLVQGAANKLKYAV